MSDKERARLRRYNDWYQHDLIPKCTDSEGQTDMISREIHKRYGDEVMFKIAAADSGTKMTARVAGAATVQFFGVTRYRYSGHRTIR